MKFQCISCDGPFSFSDTLKMSDTPRGAEANYNVMKNSDIVKMPIKDLADPKGAILAFWVPSSLLQVGLDALNANGFTHKQTYVWVKIKKDPLAKIKKANKDDIKKPENGKSYVNDMLSFGMGRLFRQTHEICLIGTNNNKIYKLLNNRSQQSVSFAENLKHSAKPEDLQNSLDKMFPTASKIELFARRQRPGWFCIGNESPMTYGEDILTSIDKMKNIQTNDWDDLNKIILNYDSSKNQELFDKWGNIIL